MKSKWQWRGTAPDSRCGVVKQQTLGTRRTTPTRGRRHAARLWALAMAGWLGQFALAADEVVTPIVVPSEPAQAVSGSDRAGKTVTPETDAVGPSPGAMRNSLPVYPPIARMLGISGRVIVRVTVDAQGRPRDATVVQRDDDAVTMFDEAALTAVMSWTFEPARDSQGQAKEFTVNVPINFTFEERDRPRTSPAVPATRAQLVVQGEPIYPPIAQQIGLAGGVVVRIFINREGHPYRTEIASREQAGQHVFDDAAALAAMQSRFHPAFDANGQAVEDRLLMPFHFDLGNIQQAANCTLTTPPDYPFAALRQGMEATIWAAVPVNAQGVVDGKQIAIVDSGRTGKVFVANTKAALAKAQCEPARSDGQPVAGWALTPVAYTLGPPLPKSEPHPVRQPTMDARRLAHLRASLRLQRPEYPALARRLGLSGKVVVRVVYDIHSGKPLRTEMASRQPAYLDVFDEAAREVAMRSRFVDLDLSLLDEPTRKSGLLVFQVPINFEVPLGWVSQTCRLKQPPEYPVGPLARGQEARIVIMARLGSKGRIDPDEAYVVHREPVGAAEFDASAMLAAKGADCSTPAGQRETVNSLVSIEVPYRLGPDGPLGLETESPSISNVQATTSSDRR